METYEKRRGIGTGSTSQTLAGLLWVQEKKL